MRTGCLSLIKAIKNCGKNGLSSNVLTLPIYSNNTICFSSRFKIFIVNEQSPEQRNLKSNCCKVHLNIK